MSKRAQQFDEELKRLEDKLSQLNDVAYEKAKIDFLHSFAEQSLEKLPHVDLLNERL